MRRPLVDAFDRSGSWLDVGCANGYLLETLPVWVGGRGFMIEPFGLELIPSIANLARERLLHLADRIFTGDVMDWKPTRRWTYVTALTDAVPPSGLAGLVDRLLEEFVEPRGRIVASSYGSSSRRVLADPVDELLTALGFEVSGSSHAGADNGFHLTRTAWLDRRG